MKNGWDDYNENLWIDDWEKEKYTPSSLGEAFGRSRISSYKKGFFLKQFIFSILIFASFLGFFISDNPKIATLQTSVRYLLVAEESDYTPIIEAMVKDNIWLDTYEKYVFDEKNTMAIPVSGKIYINFGWIETKDGKKIYNQGIDILTEPKAPVRAALGGTVKSIENTSNLGRKLIIDHGNGLTTVYSLLGEVLVDKNIKIKQGEIIGKTLTLKDGKQGRLHFEVRQNNKAINPIDKIGQQSSI